MKIILCIVLLLIALVSAANYLFFEQTLRFVAEQAGSRHNMQIRFTKAEGDIFKGNLAFQGLAIAKPGLELSVETVRLNISPVSLLSTPLINALTLQNIKGSITQQEALSNTTTSQPAPAEVVHTKRNWIAHNILIENADITVTKGDKVNALKLQSLKAETLRSDYVITDILFRSDLAGWFNGSGFRVAGGASPVMNIQQIPMNMLDPDFTSGTMDVQAISEVKADAPIIMHYDIALQSVTLALPGVSNAVAAKLLTLLQQKVNATQNFHFQFTLEASERDLAGVDNNGKPMIIKITMDNMKKKMLESNKPDLKEKAMDTLEKLKGLFHKN